MQTKPLLYGLIGFFIGGLIVSVAATTFDKPKINVETKNNSETTMSEMFASLKDKKGDDYDKAFIKEMIAHHQGAIDMAKLSTANAKHDEIKKLSYDILIAQEKEIAEMKQWQNDWNYTDSSKLETEHSGH